VPEVFTPLLSTWLLRKEDLETVAAKFGRLG